MVKFSEDLYNAQGEKVKTVEWIEIAPKPSNTPATVHLLMHPPTWPCDPVYVRQYDRWVENRIKNGLHWR